MNTHYVLRELGDHCKDKDESDAVTESIRLAHEEAIPTTLARKASRAICEVKNALKKCKSRAVKKEQLRRLCETCGSSEHLLEEWNQTHATGWARRADLGRAIFDLQTLDMHALTTVMLSIAGADKGAADKIYAQQLYEMHRTSDRPFEQVWGSTTVGQGMEKTLGKLDVQRRPDDLRSVFPKARDRLPIQNTSRWRTS